MVKIGDFNRAAQENGYVRLRGSGSEELVTYGKGIFGKTIAWLRTKLRPGTVVMEENRQVLQSFVKALKERYGDRCILRNIDLTGAKPLSARTIREITRANEAQEKAIRKFNHTIAHHAAFVGFDDCVEEIKLKQGIQLPSNSLAHARLSKEIMEAIEQLQGTPPRVISRKEAESVARRKIEEFLKAKKELLDYIKTKNLSEPEETILRELVMSQEDITREHLDFFMNAPTAREEATKLASLLKHDPPPSAEHIIRALGELSKKVSLALEQTGKSNKTIPGTDIISLVSKCIQLAMQTTPSSREKAENIYKFFSSTEGLKLIATLRAISFGDVPSASGGKERAAIMYGILSGMIIQSGHLLGKRDDEIREATATRLNMQSLQDIPKDIAVILQSENIYSVEDLNSVLTSRLGFDSLLSYAILQRNDENLLFWREVEEFKRLPESEREKKAKEIVEKFIKEDTPGRFLPSDIEDRSRSETINISSTIRKEKEIVEKFIRKDTSEGNNFFDSIPKSRSMTINISSTIRSEIERKMRENPKDPSLFENAQSEIYNSIMRNIFPEWLGKIRGGQHQ
ncbi:MAG: regulator of G-protein signaling domain-containing protein [Thermodesulforhabdaceae bacterium]